MTDTALPADRVREGDSRLHGLEAHADVGTAAEARRLFIESQSGVSLDAVGSYGFPAEATESTIENMVGPIQVPMGVAGPVNVDGGPIVDGKYPPLTTAEDTLLASANRGCSVINSVGDATTHVLKSGVTRAPVLRVTGVVETEAPVSWTRDNFAALKEAAGETTNHGEPLDVTPYVVGNSVYLRFRYDTKDAMGMNVAIIATEAVCSVIEAGTAASLVAFSGNLCSGKKPAAINAVEGCGRSVTADVRIPREIVEERPHTTPEAVVEPNTRKNLVSSAKAASLKFNAHVTNVAAAMFLATGQDEVQVAEGANVITAAEMQDGNLYVSVSIASLEVGTVGGGTKLLTQSEGLDILGVNDGSDPTGSNADALTECIAVGSLAGELSLLSALALRHLSSARAELGR